MHPLTHSFGQIELMTKEFSGSSTEPNPSRHTARRLADSHCGAGVPPARGLSAQKPHTPICAWDARTTMTVAALNS